MEQLSAALDQLIPGFGPAVPFVLPLLALMLVLGFLRRLPVIGTFVSIAGWLLIAGLLATVVAQRNQFDPAFASVFNRIAPDRQQVTGNETRIRMARDGHFWATVSIDGVERRMLVDSGATVTAVSSRTAAEAGLATSRSPVPIIIQTANGAVPAQSATVENLRLGNIRASDLAVVVSPALGEMDVIGMNFLSRLKSWRVEGKTLILVPNHPQKVAAT